MAPRSTTADVFSAVAEPRRREIISLLATGERSVNDIAHHLKLRQPEVSKQLGVLKTVGLVGVREDGRKRLYALRGEPLKTIHDWVLSFARCWAESYDRLDDYLDHLQSQEKNNEPTS